MFRAHIQLPFGPHLGLGVRWLAPLDAFWDSNDLFVGNIAPWTQINGGVVAYLDLTENTGLKTGFESPPRFGVAFRSFDEPELRNIVQSGAKFHERSGVATRNTEPPQARLLEFGFKCLLKSVCN